MKKINISDELHHKLRTYSFMNNLTMKDTISMAIERLLLNDQCSKVVNTTSSKVVKPFSSQTESTMTIFEDLDFTDREAQKLIDETLMKKFNL